MSNTTLRPASRAARAAFRLAANTCGVERCVPLISVAVALRDEGRVDVGFAQRHVGAVAPVEQQREVLEVADAEEGEPGQPRGVQAHAAHVDALARQRLADEAAEVVGARRG